MKRAREALGGISKHSSGQSSSCGCPLKRIGEDVAEKLDYAPGEFTVCPRNERFITWSYADIPDPNSLVKGRRNRAYGGFGSLRSTR